MRAVAFAIVLGAAATAVPALAVGLGPLTASGLTDGPRKGFYLTVINPYPTVRKFTLTPLAMDEDVRDGEVTIIPASVVIGGGGQRKVLAIAGHLEPGETHQFRVCAEAPPQPAEIVHARVCSKLSARRVNRP